MFGSSSPAKVVRILILENNAKTARVILSRLQSPHLNCTADIVTHWEQLKALIPVGGYDALIADYNLLEVSGPEALRWMRETGFTVPFVLLTDGLRAELAVASTKSSAADCIRKDRLDLLPGALRLALEAHKTRAQRHRSAHTRWQQHASIFHRAPYGICLTNGDGQILTANPAVATMLGYDSEAELLERNLARDFCVNAEDCWRLFSRLRQDTAGYETEATWRRKDAKWIVVRTLGRRLQTEPGAETVYEVFVQDITEQRILEREVQVAQKMEAMGHLAGGVTHDLNNQLMVIQGCADLMHHYKDQPERIEKYVQRIHDASRLSASVVQQLMALGRKHIPVQGPLHLNSVVRELGQMLPRLLGEGIKVGLNLSEMAECVSAERNQIEQIILNLAVNARQTMPHGGRFVVETASVRLDQERVRWYGGKLAPGQYIRLTVTDTAIGMDRSIQSRIFESSLGGKESGKGSALGLTTVHNLVRQTGGDIVVDSAAGRGTKFTIYFPAIAGPAAESPVPAGVAQSGSECILLVEDDAALCDVTREYLQSRGYHVLTAGSGPAAFEVCKTHRGRIDLLVIDIVMPGLSGTELAKAARDLRPGLRVIYVSGYSDRHLNLELDPRSLFLRKPYSMIDLGVHIRGLLSNDEAARAGQRSA